MERGLLTLSNVRFYVLDEADRLLDTGNRVQPPAPLSQESPVWKLPGVSTEEWTHCVNLLSVCLGISRLPWQRDLGRCKAGLAT